jgi:hypothetical protein
MEVKTSQEAQLTDSEMTGEDEKRVQKFINLFASKLRIDFNKDTKIMIDIKNKEEGRFLFIKFKDSEVNDVDVSQLNLFKGVPPPEEEPKAEIKEDEKVLMLHKEG